MIHKENHVESTENPQSPHVGVLGIPTPPNSVVPPDFFHQKLSSPDLPKSPNRSNSASPISSAPPAFPSASAPISSMSSIFSRSQNFNFPPGASFPGTYPPKDYQRLPEEYL